MPFQKGNKLATGRPRGSVNKKSLELQELAAKLDVNPVEILLLMAKGDWKSLGYDSEVYVMENASGSTKIGYTISPEMRLSAAKEVAQYLFAKLKEQPEEPEPIDVSEMTKEEKTQLLLKAKEEIKKLEDELSVS